MPACKNEVFLQSVIPVPALQVPDGKRDQIVMACDCNCSGVGKILLFLGGSCQGDPLQGFLGGDLHIAIVFFEDFLEILYCL